MSSYLGGTSGVRRRIHLGVLSAIVGVAVALAGLLFTDGLPSGSVYDPAPVTILAILLASFVTLYPFIRNLLYEEDILEPSVVIGGLLFAYFPLRAFGISVLGSSPAFPSFRSAVHGSLNAFTLGLIAITGGAIAMYSGYRLTRREKRTPTWPFVGVRRLLVANVLAIWVLSVGIHLLRTLGIFGGGNAILYHLTNWHYLAILVLLADYYRSESSHLSGTVLLSMLFVEIIVVTVVGFDLNSLLTLLTFATVAYHYRGPGFTVRKLVGVGGGILVLFPISEIAERLQSGHGLPASLGQGDLGIDWILNAFVGRMIGTDALTMIVARTPDPVPFQGGETLLFAVYGLVPRALWPGKPSIIMCGLNNQHFSGRGEAANTCAAMTVPGELYWNFGVAGVVVGLFIIGILLGGVYRWFKHGNGGPTNYVAIVIYSLVLLQVMRFESGFGQLVSNLVKGVAFAAIFLWFVTEPRTEDSIILDGRSRFERSHVFRIGKTFWMAMGENRFIPRTIINRVYHIVQTVPLRSAAAIETSRVYSFAVMLDRLLRERWMTFQSILLIAWRSSGLRRTIVRSRISQLFS